MADIKDLMKIMEKADFDLDNSKNIQNKYAESGTAVADLPKQAVVAALNAIASQMNAGLKIKELELAQAKPTGILSKSQRHIDDYLPGVN